MDAAIRFQLLRASAVLLVILIAFSGVFVAIFLSGYEPGEDANVEEAMAMLINGSLIIWIVGIPLLILVIIKYRKLELASPTRFEKLYYRGRASKQCTICQKHPASKNYHIKNVHNMKDVKVDDYFRDCGCDKCANYDQSEFTEGWRK